MSSAQQLDVIPQFLKLDRGVLCRHYNPHSVRVSRMLDARRFSASCASKMPRFWCNSSEATQEISCHHAGGHTKKGGIHLEIQAAYWPQPTSSAILAGMSTSALAFMEW